MGQDRLGDLALFSVEKETVDKIDFDTIIDQVRRYKGKKNRFVIFCWHATVPRASTYCLAVRTSHIANILAMIKMFGIVNFDFFWV